MTGAGPLLSAFPQLKDSQFFPPSTTTGSLVIGPGTSRMETNWDLNLNNEKYYFEEKELQGILSICYINFCNIYTFLYKILILISK